MQMTKAKIITSPRNILVFGAILGLFVFSVTDGKLRAKPRANLAQRVEITGADFDIMEPFISCDENTLYFNNSNAPGVNTNLYKANRTGPNRFSFQGEIAGVNSGALDGVASIDCQNQLYFISIRSYMQNFESVFTANLSARAIVVRAVRNLSKGKLGDLIFDVEISRDGNILLGVDGKFSGPSYPKAADIFIAHKSDNGFHRAANSDAIMRNINSRHLEYAPSLSADNKTLYFTRVKNRFLHQEITIEAARRLNANSAFEAPFVILKTNNVIEAPSISMDGKSLYYHEKIRNKYVIFRLPLQ